MSRSLLHNSSLYPFLLECDADLAEQTRAMGCLECRGPLHTADYPRKPRGPLPVPGARHFRFSFCCARCRRRMTPPSVRFLGAQVYWGVVVTLVTALAHGLSAHRLSVLRSELGIDRRTLERWRHFWREIVPGTLFWKVARARFAPPVAETDLPVSLVARFASTIAGLVRLLSFLKPLSTRHVPLGSLEIRRGCSSLLP